MKNSKILHWTANQRKPASNGQKNRGLPPELVSKVLPLCDSRNLILLSSFRAVACLLSANVEILNSFSKTSGKSRQECLKILRDKKAFIQLIQRGMERVITFNTNQSDMTQLSVFGNTIFVSSDDQSVKAFDFNGIEIKKFLGHTGGVWTFDYDGTRLVTGSTDKTVKIWNMASDQVLITLKYHRSTVRVLKIFGDYIITGSRDYTIAVWNVFGDLLHRLEGHEQSVRCLDVNADYLVSGSYDGYCKLWDYKRGKFIRNVHKHQDRIYTVKLMNGYIASAGYDSEVKISSIDGSVTRTHKIHDSVVAWVDIKDNCVISSSLDGTVVKYNYITESIEYVIRQRNPIKEQKITDSIIILATLNSVVIFSLKTGNFIRTLMEASLICKIEVDKWKIIVGYQQNGDYKISIFDYENLKSAI